jgi:hypothetical protein
LVDHASEPRLVQRHYAHPHAARVVAIIGRVTRKPLA